MRIMGLFETMHLHNGVLFAREAHLRRLAHGCAVLGIKPPDKNLFGGFLAAAIKKAGLKEARVRLSVLKNGAGVDVGVCVTKLPRDTRKTFSVFLAKDKKREASPLAAVNPARDRLPKTTVRRLRRLVSNGVKSVERGFYERLFKKAKEQGYDEAVFCDGKGRLSEGTRTNIFLVKRGRVFTPSLASGCLAGITRKIVLGLFKKARIPCRQGLVAPGELFEADEIFLTNAIIGVMPVGRINKKSIGSGGAGPLTRKIAEAYEKKVEKECGLG